MAACSDLGHGRSLLSPCELQENRYSGERGSAKAFSGTGDSSAFFQGFRESMSKSYIKAH